MNACECAHRPGLPSIACCVTAVGCCCSITNEECPACDGRGEVFDHLNFWGKAETRDCRVCGGQGWLSAEDAADYRGPDEAADGDRRWEQVMGR